MQRGEWHLSKTIATDAARADRLDRGSQQTPRWRERDSNLYGAFPVKGVVLVLLRVLCSERESRSSSRRLRSGSRSTRRDDELRRVHGFGV